MKYRVNNFQQHNQVTSKDSRKWDPVGLDKTYLAGQKEISTHGRLDKLIAYWTKCPAGGTNCLEDRTKHSTIHHFVQSYNLWKLVLKMFSIFFGFYRLLSDLEQISKIRTPLDICWLEDFRVETINFFWSPGTNQTQYIIS